jgi:hypothetical protein
MTSCADAPLKRAPRVSHFSVTEAPVARGFRPASEGPGSTAAPERVARNGARLTVACPLPLKF